MSEPASELERASNLTTNLNEGREDSNKENICSIDTSTVLPTQCFVSTLRWSYTAAQRRGRKGPAFSRIAVVWMKLRKNPVLLEEIRKMKPPNK